MELSPKGFKHIAGWEKLRQKAYQDDAGVWTIGYGHTGPEVKEGMVISIAEAERLFREDLQWAIDAVNKQLGDTKATQGQFDALVSLTFNIGVLGLSKASALKLLKKGDVQGAADAFRSWNKVRNKKTKVLEVNSGLVNRREADRKLFLN